MLSIMDEAQREECEALKMLTQLNSGRLYIKWPPCDTRGRQRTALASVSPAPRYTPYSSSDCRAVAWPAGSGPGTRRT